MQSIVRSFRAGRFLAAFVLSALSIIVVPAVASARCPSRASSKPFEEFGDHAHYALVEGGSFEEGAPGWSLSDATIIEENESFEVAGGGSHSLEIDSDGVAISPSFCVSSEYPSFRFVARRTSGYLGALNVIVRWTDAWGVTHDATSATVQLGTSWALTPVLRLSGVLPLWMPGSTLNVRLVFQPAWGASWAIDDVYIDPYSR
jgi:hypothetical protein